MPRRRDDDDDFDDDEYLPPQRRESRRTGFPALLLGGLVFGAVVVLASISLYAARSRQADERMAQEVAVAREQEALTRQVEPNPNEVAVTLPRRPPTIAPHSRGTPGANWAKVAGATWQREPAAKDDTGYPYLFEFREDLTARTIHVGPDGKPQPREGWVEVTLDRDDELTLVQHAFTGPNTYSFRLKPDGTLVGESPAEPPRAFTRAD
jgi:hypothetical protein